MFFFQITAVVSEIYQDCILLMYTHAQRHAVGFESSFYLYDRGENLHSLISGISRRNENHFLLAFSIRGHENWEQTSILNFGHSSYPFILFRRPTTTFIIYFHFIISFRLFSLPFWLSFTVVHICVEKYILPF